MTGGPGEGGARPPDRSRWRQVSPLLDELDALTPAERQARLVHIRAEDPALADELDAWLREDEALQAQDFMAAPALPTPTAPASLAGRVMGAYTLERELGQGGMGSVWLAHRNDGRYEGQVAVKCLRAGLLARGDVERFEREGRLLARLQHPNIARLIDAGLTPDDSQPFLVLEHVQGVPIDVFCREQALGLSGPGASKHAPVRWAEVPRQQIRLIEAAYELAPPMQRHRHEALVTGIPPDPRPNGPRPTRT